MMARNENEMEAIIIIGMDPNSLDFVGGVDLYILRLIKQLPIYGVKVTLIGIGEGYINNDKSNYPCTFIPIAKNIESVREFLFALFLKAPRLKIFKNAVIYTSPADMFPFVLFHRKNPKLCRLAGINTEETIRLLYGGIWGKIISWIYSTIEKIALRHVDYCISVSESTKRYYINKYTWLEKKIESIPAGIELDKFKPMDKAKMREKYGFDVEDKIILFIGRLEIEKNISFLIKAFRNVKKEKDNAKLVLVGDGRERVNLEMLVHTIGVRDVTFIGKVDHKNIPEIMNYADVFAFCSLYEGSPAVVKEALACGVPVVSTDVGDVKEWIENEFVGKIVDRDEEIFADALIEMMEKDRDIIRRACREVSKQFSFDLTVRKTIDVFDEVIKLKMVE